jgi:hypothetical protein
MINLIKCRNCAHHELENGVIICKLEDVQIILEDYSCDEFKPDIPGWSKKNEGQGIKQAL